MSGFDCDYKHWQIDDVVTDLITSKPDADNLYMLKRALGRQLCLINQACSAINDRKDPERIRAAIEACFKEPAKQVEVRELLAELERLKVEVERLR